MKNLILKIININLKFKNCLMFIYLLQICIKSLNLAHKLALNKKVMGVINCPIDKKLLIKIKLVLLNF